MPDPIFLLLRTIISRGRRHYLPVGMECRSFRADLPLSAVRFRASSTTRQARFAGQKTRRGSLSAAERVFAPACHLMSVTRP